jgi:hypothetical protein
MGTVLLAWPQSDGRRAVIETHARRGAAEPCHIHAREDELIYVIAGVVLVQIGEAARCHGPDACHPGRVCDGTLADDCLARRYRGVLL